MSWSWQKTGAVVEEICSQSKKTEKEILKEKREEDKTLLIFSAVRIRMLFTICLVFV